MVRPSCILMALIKMSFDCPPADGRRKQTCWSQSLGQGRRSDAQ